MKKSDFNFICEYLWKVGKNYEEFRYPDYAGLDKHISYAESQKGFKISERMSRRSVEAIRSVWNDLRSGKFKNCKEFESVLLFNFIEQREKLN